MPFIHDKSPLFDYSVIPKWARLLAQLLLMLVSILCSINTSMSVAEPLTLTLAAEDSWPPFADDVGSGISHNLIKQAFKQVDVAVSTVVVPYSRGLFMAERGTVDGVFNVTREQSTVERFVFGEQPLFTVTASFFFAKEYPTVANNKWQLPMRSTIGIVDGYEYGDQFIALVEQRKLHILRVKSQRQLINLLLVGRIDTAIMFDRVAEVYIKQLGVNQDIQAKFSNHKSEIFVAFAKQNPQAKHFSQLLDKGLLMLQKQGRYEPLLLPSHD